jgi:hypothetical protein
MYVAISADLINRVEQRINNMERAELNAAAPTFNTEHVIDASAIFNKASFGERLDLLANVPKEWLKPIENGRVNVEFKHTEADTEVNRSVSMDFRGMTYAYLRPDGGSYYGYISTPTIQLDDVLAMPETTPGRAEIIQRVEDFKVRWDIERRWKKIRHDVTQFLKSCKSLNEAVKLLPSIKMYVDKDDIQRLERKVERKPREELTINIDTGEITAAAVAARLAESGAF